MISVNVRRTFLSAWFCCVLLGSPALAGSFKPGDALVIFKNGEGGAFRTASLAASAGARVAALYEAVSEEAGGTFALLHSDTKSTEALLQDLRARPDVEAACPNYRVHLAATPDDPRYSELWGLPLIRAPQAWNTSTGASAVHVAIVDTGLNYTHEDLKANVDSERSRSCYPGLTDYGDSNGHGSHVAGIIGAVGNNGTGVTGICWTVKLIGLRTFSASDTSDLSCIIDALNHLVSLLKDDASLNLAAVNLSLSSYFGVAPSQMPTDSEGVVYWRAISALDGLNRTLIVVAAGNEGFEVGSPAPSSDPSGEYLKGDYCYPASFQGLNNMIVVAAVNQDGARAGFSNYSSRYVHLAAPGVGILSTVLNNNYGTKQGTSMAAPYVTGAAALLKAAYPDATPGKIKTALLKGATASSALSSYTTNGLLNLEGAMNYLAAHIDDSESVDSDPDSPDSDSLDSRSSGSGSSGGGGGGCDGLGAWAGLVLLASGIPLARKRR